MISNFFVELFDDDIEPRPLETPILPRPINQPTPVPIVVPEPPKLQPDPIMIKGNKHHDGITEADRLLAAIVLVAQRDPLNRAALRTLCVRFTREHALDF